MLKRSLAKRRSGRSPTTLVIDTGFRAVGIFRVEDRDFSKYEEYVGDAITKATIQRIQDADEVVTFRGDKFDDLRNLGELAGLKGELPLRGKDTDMRPICWGAGYFGKRLREIYLTRVRVPLTFPDTRCKHDVYMTWKLWELSQQGRLKVRDGQPHPATSGAPNARGPT